MKKYQLYELVFFFIYLAIWIHFMVPNIILLFVSPFPSNLNNKLDLLSGPMCKNKIFFFKHTFEFDIYFAICLQPIRVEAK